jgi:tripartite motif-containing protein 71
MTRRSATAALIATLLVLSLSLSSCTSPSRGQQAGPSEESSGAVIHEKSIYVAEDVSLNRPVGIGVGSDGKFGVTLRDSQKIMLFEQNGAWIRTWGTQGVEPGALSSPFGIAVDAKEGRVYVADRARRRLIAYSDQGEYVWEVEVTDPLTPVLSRDGILLTTADSIDRVSAKGQVLSAIGSLGKDEGQFDGPRGAAFSDNGSLIVADTDNTRVQMLNLSSTPSATVDWVMGRPPTRRDDPGTFFGEPTSVAVDARGRAYVLDSFRHAIHVIDPESGKELHRFENLQGEDEGKFNLPTGIAYLGDNRFVVTDTHNDRVQIVRIVLPGEDDGVASYPSPLWLIPLAVLALLFIFLMVWWRRGRCASAAQAG